MPLARRHAMGLGLAAGAAGLLARANRPTVAAAPQAAGQAPGFYRFMVGEIEVTLVNDGAAVRPLAEGFVRNAPLAEVQGALAAAFQPTETLTIPFTTTVINNGSRLVMIDAGNGEMGAPGTGSWHENFRAAGYAPEQVDAVILSHFHGDHIQGLRTRAGEAVFPNAELMVPEAEWAFWMDDARMGQAPEAMRQAFQNVRRVFGPVAGEVTPYGGEKELVTGVTSLPAPGHTPGHTAFVVASGGDRLLIWSDTTNKPELFVRNPGWHAVFDMDPEQAEATRRRLLDTAAGERMQVAGYHFPFPATGFIAREGDGHAFVPTFWHRQG
jgi:glyoxylase-like metal-dependent hydrolase (beta-lactamase superfamily II)